MRVRLSDHATAQCLWRNIDVSRAIATVKNPEWTGAGKNGNIKARKTFEGRLLEVVYARIGKDALIVTAIYGDQAGDPNRL